MVIFSQTLSAPEHARVLKEAQRYATGLHMSSDKFPVGKTAVPSAGSQHEESHPWQMS